MTKELWAVPDFAFHGWMDVLCFTIYAVAIFIFCYILYTAIKAFFDFLIYQLMLPEQYDQRVIGCLSDFAFQ